MHTDRPIYYRSKPSREYKIKYPNGCLIADSTIDILDELKECYAVITYGSRVAIECMLSGVPVFTLNRRHITYDMSYNDLSQIENLDDYDYQKRLQWLYDISYCQWNLDEMGQGLPHKHLGVI